MTKISIAFRVGVVNSDADFSKLKLVFDNFSIINLLSCAQFQIENEIIESIKLHSC